MLKASENAYLLITHFEGFREIPYLCPGGYRTIGFGHKIRPGEHFTYLTPEEAVELLEKDIAPVERAINKFVTVPLEQHEFDALVSFVYNVGIIAFYGSTLRQKLNRDDDREEVANEFPRWVYSGGRILKGLVRRRLAERTLFLTGVLQI